jgi:hypothetical protein
MNSILKKNNLFYSSSTLIIINLIPIIGVLFMGWNSATLILAYWIESAIIGFFTILKMRKAKNLGKPPKNIRFNKRPLDVEKMGRSGTIFFFLFHYGLFMFVHLIFLLVFITQGIGNITRPVSSLSFITNLLIFSIVIFISHLQSYIINFIGQQEYKKKTVAQLFTTPYKRIIPMHIAIIFGAFLLPTAILLVILKTVIDLFSHINEHKNTNL